MAIYDHLFYDEHENVHFFSDKKTGLKAIIALHSTLPGPAVGGCRLWSYKDSTEALKDVLRLSRGMSYKNAMADLPMGGGKSVIIKPEDPFDRTALFSAFGKCVDSLGGRYITAEDVRVTPDDMHIVHQETPHVVGLPEGDFASGDPSPVTALGVFYGLKATVRHALGKESLEGIRVGVQGLGHVGAFLCDHLSKAGAQLTVTDISDSRSREITEKYGAKLVSPEKIYDEEVDVFAPCALGGSINEKTLPRLKAKIIAGAANNQLSHVDIGAALLKRGIVYAPDYVINAGGIINVASEVAHRPYDFSWVDQKLHKLAETLKDIYLEAQKNNLPTNEVANRMAQMRLEAVWQDQQTKVA